MFAAVVDRDPIGGLQRAGPHDEREIAQGGHRVARRKHEQPVAGDGLDDVEAAGLDRSHPHVEGRTSELHQVMRPAGQFGVTDVEITRHVGHGVQLDIDGVAADAQQIGVGKELDAITRGLERLELTVGAAHQQSGRRVGLGDDARGLDVRQRGSFGRVRRRPPAPRDQRFVRHRRSTLQRTTGGTSCSGSRSASGGRWLRPGRPACSTPRAWAASDPRRHSTAPLPLLLINWSKCATSRSRRFITASASKGVRQCAVAAFTAAGSSSRRRASSVRSI